MNNTPRPNISPDFTIDDIHKIREWNYERRKGMSRQEVIDDINRGAAEFNALIDKMRLDTSVNADVHKEVSRRLSGVRRTARTSASK